MGKHEMEDVGWLCFFRKVVPLFITNFFVLHVNISLALSLQWAVTVCLCITVLQWRVIGFSIKPCDIKLLSSLLVEITLWCLLRSVIGPLPFISV